jgi:hypothetical protein
MFLMVVEKHDMIARAHSEIAPGPKEQELPPLEGHTCAPSPAYAMEDYLCLEGLALKQIIVTSVCC